MNSDCAFAIGRAHRVCQDYAVTGGGDDGVSAFVLLADGCSSSPDSDIGARLLVKAAQRFLPSPSAGDGEWEAAHNAALRRAAQVAQDLDLHLNCLDTTLLTITASGGAFAVNCCGDGIVALGRSDGGLEVYAVSYAASYPNYLNYRLDDGRRAQWELQPGNEKRITHWTLGADGMTNEASCLSRCACETWAGTADEYRFAAVLSDGVQSFTETCETDTSRSPRPVPLAELLPPLLAFKGSRGQFVQRRAASFFKECHTRRLSHGDDFSLGVVWM